MNKKHILIVDDEQALRELVRDYLLKANYSVSEAVHGEEALAVYFSAKIDLVVLDIMMPKMNGYEVLSEIRRHADTPVIMLTAKGDEGSEVQGFRLKADDYVVKPFSAKALLARIEAVLRRYRMDFDREKIGVLEYDKNRYDVVLEGESLNLSKKEFELFTYLLQNKNIVLSREQLLNNVWGYQYEGELRTVDTYIKMLRKRLTPKADYIKTVRGVGYKFEVRP